MEKFVVNLDMGKRDRQACKLHASLHVIYLYDTKYFWKPSQPS